MLDLSGFSSDLPRYDVAKLVYKRFEGSSSVQSNQFVPGKNVQIAFKDSKAAFTRTLFHLKPHRFRCSYAFCLHDTDRDRCRNRVDLKTLSIVERFQNDTDSSDV